jgi:hypothetical protein
MLGHVILNEIENLSRKLNTGVILTNLIVYCKICFNTKIYKYQAKLNKINIIV